MALAVGECPEFLPPILQSWLKVLSSARMPSPFAPQPVQVCYMTRPHASPSLPASGLSNSAGGHVVSVVAPSAAETTVSAALFAAATVAEASLTQVAAHASAFAQAPPAAQVLAAELQHQLLRREGYFVEGDLDHGGDVLGLGVSGEDRLGGDAVGLGTAVDAHKGALLHAVHALAERGQGVVCQGVYGCRSPSAQQGRPQQWEWEQQGPASGAGSTAGAWLASVQAGIVGASGVEQDEEDEVLWLWNQSGAAIEYKTADR